MNTANGKIGGNHVCKTAVKSTNQQSIVSSTPKEDKKSIMNTSFTKCFRQGDTFVVDNDSGYVSTNPESSMDFHSTNTSCDSLNAKPIYLCEDALLEKPEVCQQQAVKEEEAEYDHLYYLSDSIVAPSCESEKTTFSGFGGESENEKDVSSQSLVIPVITPIKVCVDDVCVVASCSKQNNKTNESGCDRNVETVDYSNVKTPEKAYKNPMTSDVSPDLFSDEEEPIKTVETNNKILSEKYVHPNDQKLIKRAQESLSGVFPPPSVTYFCMSVSEMLERINDNKHLFADGSKGQIEIKSLLVTESSKDSIKNWPEILEQRYHGLYFNRSKLSEDFEQLCIKYGQRYVGAETHSSCTIFETNFNGGSPSKRKSSKLRWNAKSPGRRLSHLARRRITFNNPALQNSGTSSTMVCSRARQILVDARRLELLSRRKSPRKTPRKSPRVKGRTPTSSAKKRLALQFRMYSEGEEEEKGPIASTSNKVHITKRALFQSPEKGSGGPSMPIACLSGLAFNANSYSKRTTPKRALFASPKKNSPSKNNGLDRKRKRNDDEDSTIQQQQQSSKLLRSVSADVHHPSTSSGLQKLPLQRRASECSSTSSRSCDLSAHHKKKLQWAVYEALKSKSIGVSHPQFKMFASTLARVTRRFLPNLSANVPRPEGGTSEKMLRIARQHVHAVVVNGKTVDEIVSQVELSNRNKIRKPVGYVGLNEESSARNDKENLSQKKTVSGENDENAKSKHLRVENKIDRIRKVIDFGDDDDDSDVIRDELLR